MPTSSDGGANTPAARPAAAVSSVSAGARNNPGRNRGRGGRDRRGVNRQMNYSGWQRNNPTRFEGREPTSKGFICALTGELNPDQFIKTTKEMMIG